MSNLSKLQVLSKEQLSIKDICVLMEVCPNKAGNYKREFLAYYENNSVQIRGTPTDLFCKYYNINEKRIEKYARLEKEGLINEQETKSKNQVSA